MVSQKKLKTVQMEHDCNVVPDDEPSNVSEYLSYLRSPRLRQKRGGTGQ